MTRAIPLCRLFPSNDLRSHTFTQPLIPGNISLRLKTSLRAGLRERNSGYARKVIIGGPPVEQLQLEIDLAPEKDWQYMCGCSGGLSTP